MWSRAEYARRLDAQARDELEQVVAWKEGLPIGRGMVLFPDHDEYSTSALRERCAEARDVFVVPDRRRQGVARAVMTALERASRDRGMRIGLSVSVGEDDVPARALYAALGYWHAHGPYLTSTNLAGDDGPIPAGAVLEYLVKDP